MSGNTEKPYLAIAALCEHALEETDNVLSGIRFVDSVVISGVGAESPTQFPPLILTVWAIIAFKAGPARGKRTIRLVVNDARGGRKEIIQPQIATFDGGEKGVNIRAQLRVMAMEEGLHWIDVLVDDEVITRMPLRVTYEQAPSLEAETSR